MKKYIILFISISLLSLGCKKKYTCQCVETYQLGTYSEVSVNEEESEKLSSKEAEDWCDSEATKKTGYTRSCELLE